MATDAENTISEDLPQNAILEAINRILQKALTCGTEEQLGAFCLSVAGDLTRSEFGFIGEIGQDGRGASFPVDMELAGTHDR